MRFIITLQDVLQQDGLKLLTQDIAAGWKIMCMRILYWLVRLKGSDVASQPDEMLP
jgi:hypothetical protein